MQKLQHHSLLIDRPVDGNMPPVMRNWRTHAEDPDQDFRMYDDMHEDNLRALANISAPLDVEGESCSCSILSYNPVY